MANAFRDPDPEYADARKSVQTVAQVIVMIIVLAWLCLSCFGLWLGYLWLTGRLY